MKTQSEIESMIELIKNQLTEYMPEANTLQLRARKEAFDWVLGENLTLVKSEKTGGGEEQ